ncbi:fibronectin type III domain-containing protein, partial [Paenibacillus forsythiae]
ETVTGSTYMLDGLNNGQSYSLYVTAINDQELESDGSAAVTVTPQAADSPAPAEVSGASATDDGSAVTLTWNNPDSPDFDRVDIYLNGGLIGSSSSGSYTAEGLSAETDYSFTLRTVDRSGNASQGISLSIRTKDITPLTAPAQVSVTGGPSRVSVSWAANTESDLAGYNVYVNGRQMNAEPLLQNNYVATGLDFGTNYSIQVEAVDTSGNRSPLSVAVSATPTHYLIDLARWGIYNDGTHPVETVKGINQALAWAHQNGITATTLPAGTYLIDKNSRIAMVGNMLFDLPMDAILQKETNGKERYDVMYVGYGANNVTLRGGTYLGDKLTHDYSQREPHNSGTHEGGYGIFIEGAANTTIDGVKAMNFTGDGLVLGGYGTMFKDLYAASFVPGGLDGSGQPRSDSTKIRTREGIYFTHPIFKTERTFEISNLINLPGGFTVYFYRADGSFITSQQATARQTLTIPGGAAYFHLVFNKASSTGAYLEAWNRTVSQNTVVKNSEFAFNRRQGITVGGADNALIMNNILHDMKGTAPQSGIDVEGGFGQNGSLNTNIYIRNNEFYNNAAYDVILYDGHDVTVEGNHLASKGAIGLAVSESFRNALAVNNHFDGSRIVAYHDATFLNNRLNDSYTYFAGPNIIIDGMEVTNGTLSVSARTTGGIKVSNVNINITKNVDAGFSLNGKGIEVSNVTITGKGALTSFKSSTTESSVFNNIKVLGFNSAYGMTLPPGTYTNSVFEAADGSRFGQTIVANGKYSFDNCTFTSNATGNTALIASHAKLDLRITNSRFIVKGDAPAITVETANKVVLENNTVTAMNLTRTATELIKINDYWKRNDPADILSATITGNTITSNIAAVGISTIYAGTGAPPYTVTNNTLTKAVLALKSNDVQSGNVLK